MTQERDDLALITRFKESGDLMILAELYQRYTHLVYGLCLKYLKHREDSKDAVMQIFEKLIQSLKQHEVQHFKSWLYVLTKNHCLMQLRERKKAFKLQENIGLDAVENTLFLHHEDELEVEVNLLSMEKCMEELSQEQNLCIKLFYLEERCYKEIAETTGFNLKLVKSYIQNGKRNLKNCMERKNG